MSKLMGGCVHVWYSTVNLDKMSPSKLLNAMCFYFLFRIMDCFLADGIEVIFRLALALLLLGKNELLVQDMEGVIRVNIISIYQLSQSYFENKFQYFQRDMPTKFESDPETVFTAAYNVKINQKKMKRMEKEYTTMKTKEKEDEIELRVRMLRKEFAIIRNRS